MPSLLVAVALFGASLGVLLVASDLFTGAAERLSLSFGIPPFLVGATVVAGGTSLPELLASTLAVYADAPGIVLGTVVGSNVANLFLVLGLAGLASRTLHIERELVNVDLPLLMASAVFLLVATWDGVFVWYEGLIGILALGIYVHYMFSTRGRLEEVVEELVEEHTEQPEPILESEEVTVEPAVGIRTYVTIIFSLAVLLVAADQFVTAILDIAGQLGIGTDLVAVTAVAVGTSLPEIAVSVTAIRRGSSELTVGNILGSNIFNTFAVVGIPSLIAPLTVPADITGYVLPVMVIATLLYYFITQNRVITQWEAVALLVLYGVFLMNLGL